MIKNRLSILTSPLPLREGVGVRLLSLLLFMWSASLWAADDPFPDVNPHGYYGSMIMTAKVMMGETLYTEDVILAVYADDQIRGKGSPSDPNNPGAIYLDVYGNEEGEQLHFRVSIGGQVVEFCTNFAWRFNATVGTPRSPYIIDLANAQGHDYGTDGSCTFCGRHSYAGITVISSEEGHTIIFDGTSEQTVSIPLPITASYVEYDRQFEPGKPMSIFLPFAITEEMEVDGGKFYSFSAIERQEDKWVATITQVKNLEANMPYIILPNDDHLSIDFCGQTVIVQTEAKTPVNIDGWSLCGTYEKLVWYETGTDYGFPAGENDDDLPHKLVRLTIGDYILPLHCYLSYVGAPDSPLGRKATPLRIALHELPDIIEVVFVNESVGIKEIYNGQWTVDNEDDAVYNLAGQRVSIKALTQRGSDEGARIFIVNGAKVLY